jgi:hypothetical protein
METEILQTVLTEMLEEFKDPKHQQVKLTSVVSDLTNKVDDFELKLSNIKVTAAAPNLEPITEAVHEQLFRIGGIMLNTKESQYLFLNLIAHFIFNRSLLCIISNTMEN